MLLMPSFAFLCAIAAAVCEFSQWFRIMKPTHHTTYINIYTVHVICMNWIESLSLMRYTSVLMEIFFHFLKPNKDEFFWEMIFNSTLISQYARNIFLHFIEFFKKKNSIIGKAVLTPRSCSESLFTYSSIPLSFRLRNSLARFLS